MRLLRQRGDSVINAGDEFGGAEPEDDAGAAGGSEGGADGDEGAAGAAGDEEEPADNEEDWMDWHEAGGRIFVLTPQGETLQKYGLDGSVNAMAVLGDDRLVIKTYDDGAIGLRAFRGI